MKTIIYLTLLSIFMLFITSCYEKRNDNPELSDLIYIDIQEDITAIEKVLVLRETEIKKVHGELKLLPPRSPGIEVAKNRIKAMSDDVERYKQLKLYLGVKLKKRSVLAKMKYELSLTEKKSGQTI